MYVATDEADFPTLYLLQRVAEPQKLDTAVYSFSGIGHWTDMHQTDPTYRIPTRVLRLPLLQLNSVDLYLCVLLVYLQATLV